MVPGKIAPLVVILVLALPPVSVSRQGGQGSTPPPPAGVSMIQSGIIPGWGEFSLGKVKRGRIFTEIEVMLWVAVVQSGQVTQRYDSRLRSFGALHAGVSFSGRDDQFVTDVGNYMNLDAFNEAQQRLREPSRVYRDPDIYGWSWDSNTHRKTYRKFRIWRDMARKVGRFVIGGMVLNRIASVIDVAYIHRIDTLSSHVTVYPLMDPQTGVTGLGASVRF